jgi:hypothetical protein
VEISIRTQSNLQTWKAAYAVSPADKAGRPLPLLRHQNEDLLSNSSRPDAEPWGNLDRRADGGRNARDNMALASRNCNTGGGSIDWLSYAT